MIPQPCRSTTHHCPRTIITRAHRSTRFNEFSQLRPKNVTALPRAYPPGVRGPGAPHQHVCAVLRCTTLCCAWRCHTCCTALQVYVAPEHRNRGHFKRLYDHVRREAAAAGAAGLRLYVDDHNAKAQLSVRNFNEMI